MSNTNDWTGNSKSVFSTLGASSHSDSNREINDFYATDPIAIDKLIQDGEVKFVSPILEPACGDGVLSKKLKEYGYEVISRDLIDRGYGDELGIDFLDDNRIHNGTILTNPPYKLAQEFVEHVLDIVTDGNKVFMFLKLQFLEGKARRKLFNTKQLKTVYVSSSRILCVKNGQFDLKKRKIVVQLHMHGLNLKKDIMAIQL